MYMKMCGDSYCEVRKAVIEKLDEILGKPEFAEKGVFNEELLEEEMKSMTEVSSTACTDEDAVKDFVEKIKIILTGVF